MTRRTLEAPAKINLGLEILGRREDGYHEIRSILCMVSLDDTLTFEPSPTGADDLFMQPGLPDVAVSDNLIIRTLTWMRECGARIAPQRITVTKRIPAAAGLGGASSDAAATLLAFAGEARDAGLDLSAIAPDLGSDVPFFLDGPIALAEGRGERLTRLPPPLPGRWVVLVTPRGDIPEKTRTMYRAIDLAWWSSGEAVRQIAARLPSLPATAPVNVFERALLRLRPELSGVKHRLATAGAPFVALTGAGPTFYTLLDSKTDADAVADQVSGTDVVVNVARLAARDES